MKTEQNIKQLRLVSSVHNEKNKNDKGGLGIIISKNFSLDFCCDNTLVKIRKTCTKLSAAANAFQKPYVRGLIEEGNNNSLSQLHVGAFCCLFLSNMRLKSFHLPYFGWKK